MAIDRARFIGLLNHPRVIPRAKVALRKADLQTGAWLGSARHAGCPDGNPKIEYLEREPSPYVRNPDR